MGSLESLAYVSYPGFLTGGAAPGPADQELTQAPTWGWGVQNNAIGECAHTIQEFPGFRKVKNASHEAAGSCFAIIQWQIICCLSRLMCTLALT